MNFEQLAHQIVDANLIGNGDLAKVYRVQLLDGQEIAVKVYRNDAGKEKHWKNEETALRELNDPGHNRIIRLLGSDSLGELANRQFFLAFPVIDGGTVHDRMHREMDWDMTIRIVQQTADALRYLHDTKNMVHNDVKPQNMLLDQADNVILVHFSGAVEKGLTAEICSPPYRRQTGRGPMAWKADPKDDVYAFGITFLQLLMKNQDPVETLEAATTKVGHGRTKQHLVHPSMMGTEGRAEVRRAENMFRLALDCIKIEDAPDIATVVTRLANV